MQNFYFISLYRFLSFRLLFLAVGLVGSYGATMAQTVTSTCPADGINWVARSVTDDRWRSITYGNNLFVAVALSFSDQIMTSPDGITWTDRTAVKGIWTSITYGNGLFVAVANSGPTSTQVMTSPDGITWTYSTSAGERQWLSVTYGNGLFVAAAVDGAVMTSPDGTSWTLRSPVGGNGWNFVSYINGLFVAVGDYGVKTSADGINWTVRRTTTTLTRWNSVTYGNGLFVAVALFGEDRVMTSADGINWTIRTPAADQAWSSVTYGNGVFVAVGSNSTNRLMTSVDGITWTQRVPAEDNQWLSVIYANDRFVAVADNGSNRVMTSTGEVTPSVRIDASPGNSITPGTSVTFTATPTFGGLSPTYVWKKNDAVIPNETGATYTTTTLADGDKIKVEMTGNDACASPIKPTSNVITMVVAAAVPNGPVCSSFTNKTTADGLARNTINGVHVVDSKVYVTTSNGGLSISTDGGNTFTTKTTANGLGSNFLEKVYASGSTVYVATSGQGLSISTDGGNSFTTKKSSDGLGSNLVTSIYASGSTVYAITGGGLSISTDGGNSFVTKTMDDGLGSLVQNDVYALSSTVYVATYGGLSISIDGGNSFTTKTTSNGLGSNTVNSVHAFASKVYAATNSGLSISTDGGNTFVNKTTSNGLGSNNVLAVYVLGSTVYAATNSGLSISTNGGDSFTNYNTSNGLGNNLIKDVYVSGSTIYAATNGGLSFCDADACTPVIPSVAIAANPSGSITTGTSVTFTATPTNGGTTPTYVWKKNNVTISNEAGATYTTTTLADGDKIKVEMTSNAACASPATATSSETTMAVTTPCTNPTAYTVTGGGVYCAGGTGVVIGLSSSESGVTYQLKKDDVDEGAPVAGTTGEAISFGTKTAAGVYTVVATRTVGACTSTMTGSVIVTVTPAVIPSVTIVANPSTSITTGTSVTFTATPTNGGTTPTYVWKKNDVTILNEMGATYTTTTLADGDKIKVEMTSNAACPSPATATSNEIAMVVCSLPTSYTVTGGGAYCAGGSGLVVGLSNSQVGVNYQLKKDGSNVGSVVAGTGSAISFGAQTEAGTYTVEATTVKGICVANMTGNAVVSVIALPMAYNVTGGGHYCSGSSGSVVGLSSSQVGVNYQLKKDGSNVGSLVAGTGSAISFGAQTEAGTYTVEATTATGGCVASMTGNAVVTINPLPSLMSVTGGGSFCPGGTGVLVGLSGSEVGISYQLKKGEVSTGNVLNGTGSALSFGNQTSAGTYTVVATNTATNCTASMTGSASVMTYTLPTAVVSGTVSVCKGGSAATVTFTGSNGVAPYTFNYQVNGSGQTVTTTGGSSSVTVSQSTSTEGIYTYTLVSVSDANCSQTQGGSTVVTVQTKPTIILNTLQQTLNEGNSQTFCDTDANPVNSLQFNVSGLCVVGSPVWRVQVGSGGMERLVIRCPSLPVIQ